MQDVKERLKTTTNRAFFKVAGGNASVVTSTLVWIGREGASVLTR